MSLIISNALVGYTKLTGSLHFAAVLAAFLAIYRFFVFICLRMFSELEIVNNLSSILVMVSISIWCWLYADYRRNPRTKRKDLIIMRITSLLAGIFCALRVLTAAFYFSTKIEDANPITFIYVICDILLWIALTVFFLSYWESKSKAVAQHTHHHSNSAKEHPSK